MNRSIRGAATVFTVLLAVIGLGATAASADEPVQSGTVVSEVVETVLPGVPRDSMVWD